MQSVDNFEKEIAKEPEEWQKKVLERVTKAKKILATSAHGKNFTIQEKYGKMKCNLTGHEINPMNVADFVEYITKSPKYLQALYNSEFDFDFCKFIIPHKQHPSTKLYCTIT